MVRIKDETLGVRVQDTIEAGSLCNTIRVLPQQYVRHHAGAASA